MANKTTSCWDLIEDKGWGRATENPSGPSRNPDMSHNSNCNITVRRESGYGQTTGSTNDQNHKFTSILQCINRPISGAVPSRLLAQTYKKCFRKIPWAGRPPLGPEGDSDGACPWNILVFGPIPVRPYGEKRGSQEAATEAYKRNRTSSEIGLPKAPCEAQRCTNKRGASPLHFLVQYWASTGPSGGRCLTISGSSSKLRLPMP